MTILPLWYLAPIAAIIALITARFSTFQFQKRMKEPLE